MKNSQRRALPGALTVIQGQFPARSVPSATRRAEVVSADESGLLVQCADGERFHCDVIEVLAASPFVTGDAVLISTFTETGERAVVHGRVLPYRPAGPASLALQAGDKLTLRCGQSSIEMSADGKVLIRGEDVLIRAKGTKRIRAGTVSIN